MLFAFPRGGDPTTLNVPILKSVIPRCHSVVTLPKPSPIITPRKTLDPSCHCSPPRPRPPANTGLLSVSADLLTLFWALHVTGIIEYRSLNLMGLRPMQAAAGDRRLNPCPCSRRGQPRGINRRQCAHVAEYYLAMNRDGASQRQRVGGGFRAGGGRV